MSLFKKIKNLVLGRSIQTILEELRTIEIEEGVGFFVKDYEGKNTSSVRWTDTEQVYFSKDHRLLYFVSHEGKKITVSHKAINWATLMRSIPTRFRDFGQEYVNTYFASLQPCNACGLMAVHRDICRHCYCSPYTELDIADFDTEEAYWKEQQCSVFSEREDVSYGFVPERGTVFLPDPSWKPLITKKDLEDWIKENYPA